MKSTKTKKNKVRLVAQGLQQREPPPKGKRRVKNASQLTMEDCFGIHIESDTILDSDIIASGDALIDKPVGTMRIAVQNPNGIKLVPGMKVMPEVAAIASLQLDVAGFPEANLKAHGHTEVTMKRQLNQYVGSSRIYNSAAPTLQATTSDYQPGGALLAVMDRFTGRVIKHSCDKWGRYSWARMRGNRGEGVTIFNVYRVCQKRGTKSGPNTAFTRQVNEMLQEELGRAKAHAIRGTTIPYSNRSLLDPRSRVLRDLHQEITEERKLGFRPIVMMDANEDWTASDGKDLREFMVTSGLVDPLTVKFGNDGVTPTTYARGKRRIDFIFMDEKLIPAVQRIGTLGLHEAMFSDHVMIYVDLDEKKLFSGIINRPVAVPSREFILAQADKCEKFIKLFLEIAEKRQLEKRVYQLRDRFKKEGPSEELEVAYNKLDSEIQEVLLVVAKKVVRKKYGYARSPTLGVHGIALNFWKSILSSKLRHTDFSKRTVALAEQLGADLAPISEMSKCAVRTQVAKVRNDLRQAQYNASALRQEWLETNARDVARASKEIDWQKNMREMVKQEKEREINRKLTAIVKGPHQSLDWIEVPTAEWYYSHEKKEIYRYDKGVFECYSAWSPSASLIPTHPWQFYKHHRLKVPHSDIVEAQVAVTEQYIILTAIHKPSNLWKTVSDAKEIEKLILERNKRHLQQASIEVGRTHNPLIGKLLHNQGTDLIQEVLDGTLPLDDAADEAVTAWVKCLIQTETEAKLPPITGEISPEEFSKAFKVVAERTSSSPSGLHYTIWKCIAAREDISKWMSIMMSLPFMYGFINTRWTRSIDVMLEKKRGNRKIHMLRIIGLLEADFNTALKIIFAKKMMNNAEKAGLSDEQWGSRKHRMALDPAMRNMMTFEYGRYMRATIAMFAADLSACFDRMFPPLSNIIAGKFGVDVNALRARGKTIDALERAVRTGHGVSDQTYGNRDGEPMIRGEYQGKGDVASLYAALSSTVMQAHSKVYKGLELPPPAPGPGIKKRNDAYVDDANTWAGQLEREPDAVDKVLHELKRGAQSLTDLQDVSGGAMAFYKCFIQLMAWKAGPNRLELRTQFDNEFILSDPEGAPSLISILRPDEANAGLGYHLAVDANQTHEYKSRYGKISAICAAAQSSKLDFDEATRLLNQRLLAQTKYGLHLSQYNAKQCHALSVLINATFLPLLHIHRKMSRAVVWGPICKGGIGLNTNILSVQTQCATKYLMRIIRWDDIVSRDVIASINALQLLSGFDTPVLENTSIPIKYVGPGWLPNLRDMLRVIEAGVWIEKAWKPKKQRQHDQAIMEVFAADPNITPLTLILANEFRVWMRVIYVSEIASMDGTAIPYDRFSNDSEWRATPVKGLKWPNTIEPTSKHRAAFRKCLRMTLCPWADPRSIRQDYKLEVQLGKWYPHPRNIEYTAYRSKHSVYYRDEMGLHKGVQTSNKGYFQIDFSITVDNPPLKSHPIEPNFAHYGVLWTHKPRAMIRQRVDHSVIHVTRADLNQDESGPIDLISDASVHVNRCEGAATWIAVNQKDEMQSVDKPLEVYDKSYSYREEMLGIYYGLDHTITTLPNVTVIRCHCDNEAGVNKINEPIESPGQLMGRDMDVVMAIQNLVHTSGKQITFAHVEGHVEKKRPGEKPTRLERYNQMCDEEANLCVQEGNTPSMFTPLKGSRCMVRIKKKWITSAPEKAIEVAYTDDILSVYTQKKLGIDEATAELLEDRHFLHVRSTHDWHRIVRESKRLFSWLPVGHNWRHHGAENDLCPCCGEPDETFIHLLQCKSPEMVALRRQQFCRMKESAINAKLPREVYKLAEAMWVTVCESAPYEDIHAPDPLCQVLEDQRRVGLHNFVIGWFVKSWAPAMTHYGSKDPVGQVAQLLTILWDGLCEPVWEMRNNILHKKPNPTVLRETEHLREKLDWFRKHKSIAIAPRHYYLASYTERETQRWDRAQCRAQIGVLENAQQIFALECQQRMRGQRVITEYFSNNR